MPTLKESQTFIRPIPGRMMSPLPNATDAHSVWYKWPIAATAWNPGLILGNVGYELLTSTPLWFGGGYLFGVAMRPVRVEARAFETSRGYPVWQAMEESAYAWGALKQLPEAVREKKEVQLQLNMAEILESLGDSLTKQEYLASGLRGQPEFARR